MPAPGSHVVSVSISDGATTYAIGSAIVRRGVARLHLRIVRTMHHAPYRVTIITVYATRTTETHYTTQL